MILEDYSIIDSSALRIRYQNAFTGDPVKSLRNLGPQTLKGRWIIELK